MKSGKLKFLRFVRLFWGQPLVIKSNWEELFSKMLKGFTSAIKGRKVTYSNSSRDLRTERKSWVPCRKETKRYHKSFP